MHRYVLGFEEIDRTRVASVGGKGANLADLHHLDGVNVPAGFCVTTDAFRLAVAGAPSVPALLERLRNADPEDRDSLRALGGDLRAAIESAPVPAEVASAIDGALVGYEGVSAWAVRSSATAEDQPTASFAGQHDSYLDVDPADVAAHVRRCWASLYTERAIIYRARRGVDHGRVQMAVVVQQLLAPAASGVLFTADPVTSNRRVVAIEATPSRGDALVSGQVNADVTSVRDDALVDRTATAEHAVLTDAQALRLAQLGRRIAAHFSTPQDVEWCLVGDTFHVVQSRPITTLFPVPIRDDGAPHVYISVGHQQMMTDPMLPLGLSVWKLTALRPMFDAGGRLFVDVTAALGVPSSRAALLDMAGRSDPLLRDALQSVLDRSDLVPTVADPAPSPGAPPGAAPAPIETDPAIVTQLIARTEASVQASARAIDEATGEALLDVIEQDLDELRRVLADPQSMAVVLAGIDATWWLNDQLHAWLGEQSAADTLTLSAPNNVTSEMGLALLDVADVIRPHPAVVSLLEEVADEGFLDRLPAVAGGGAARDAIVAYLDRYGMRCVGEIDITRPRWSERPSTLVPAILANVRTFEPGERRRRVERGLREAHDQERDVLRRLRALPAGEEKAAETKRMIDRVRTFIGYREYPKYGMISRYLVYKRALLAEAQRLVDAQVLRAVDDLYFLSVQELRHVIQTGRVDHRLVTERRDAWHEFRALTVPRVLTSDGETFAGSYRRDGLPPGSLVGIGVSSGTVEGRARVVVEMSAAGLESGDILVTRYTDPSWSPLFVQASGLVTEVGGAMTHGAVIAREYGLPAVVGVEHATQLVRDGQRIRVDGTRGTLELLPG